MAAAVASMALSTPSTAISRDFQALKYNNAIRLNTPSLAPVRSRGGALAARCDYLGSPTNLIMVASTTFLLLAGRFGLAPSTNRRASAGLKLSDNESGLQTGDPAGFTGTDTLAFGAMGHIIGVGVVLGLKAVGSI